MQGVGGGETPEVLSGAHPFHAQTSPPYCVRLAVGRKQFMRFEWANHAAEALGCEYEELNTATFKHHLRQIIEQVTSGPSRRRLEEEETSSGAAPLPPWVGWVPPWARPSDTPAHPHLLIRTCCTWAF